MLFYPRTRFKLYLRIQISYSYELWIKDKIRKFLSKCAVTKPQKKSRQETLKLWIKGVLGQKV